MSASHTRRVPLPASFGPSESRPRPSVPSDEHTPCRREIQRLLIENARLSRDLTELRVRCDDLKHSADIWIRLYEQHLRRKEHDS